MREFIITTAVCLSAMSQMMAQNISGKIVRCQGRAFGLCKCSAPKPSRFNIRQWGCEWREWLLFHRLLVQRWNNQGNFRRI